MDIQKNCLACGDLISVRLADHRRGWGKFCDKACAAAHKCGMRPRDVNATHAESSAWAADRVAHFSTAYGGKKPPTAANVRSQAGRKEKVLPLYHSPAICRGCGARVNGPGLCQKCEDHAAAMDADEMGWDAHKVWSA
jgi:hypothetical protein